MKKLLLFAFALSALAGPAALAVSPDLPDYAAPLPAPPEPVCHTVTGVQNYGGGCTATYIYYVCGSQVESCTQINAGCGAYNYDGPCGG
jgi:hypothetical protein